MNKKWLGLALAPLCTAPVSARDIDESRNRAEIVFLKGNFNSGSYGVYNSYSVILKTATQGLVLCSGIKADYTKASLYDGSQRGVPVEGEMTVSAPYMVEMLRPSAEVQPGKIKTYGSCLPYPDDLTASERDQLEAGNEIPARDYLEAQAVPVYQHSIDKVHGPLQETKSDYIVHPDFFRANHKATTYTFDNPDAQEHFNSISYPLYLLDAPACENSGFNQAIDNHIWNNGPLPVIINLTHCP